MLEHCVLPRERISNPHITVRGWRKKCILKNLFCGTQFIDSQFSVLLGMGNSVQNLLMNSCPLREWSYRINLMWFHSLCTNQVLLFLASPYKCVCSWVRDNVGSKMFFFSELGKNRNKTRFGLWYWIVSPSVWISGNNNSISQHLLTWFSM